MYITTAKKPSISFRKIEFTTEEVKQKPSKTKQNSSLEALFRLFWLIVHNKSQTFMP